MTQQIAEAVAEMVSPRGVGVLCEAQHFCLMMPRGKQTLPITITSTMLGDSASRKPRGTVLALCGATPEACYTEAYLMARQKQQPDSLRAL